MSMSSSNLEDIPIMTTTSTGEDEHFIMFPFEAAIMNTTIHKVLQIQMENKGVYSMIRLSFIDFIYLKAVYEYCMLQLSMKEHPDQIRDRINQQFILTQKSKLNLDYLLDAAKILENDGLSNLIEQYKISQRIPEEPDTESNQVTSQQASVNYQGQHEDNSVDVQQQQSDSQKDAQSQISDLVFASQEHKRGGEVNSTILQGIPQDPKEETYSESTETDRIYALQNDSQQDFELATNDPMQEGTGQSGGDQDNHQTRGNGQLESSSSVEESRPGSSIEVDDKTEDHGSQGDTKESQTGSNNQDYEEAKDKSGEDDDDLARGGHAIQVESGNENIQTTQNEQLYEQRNNNSSNIEDREPKDIGNDNNQKNQEMKQQQQEYKQEIETNLNTQESIDHIVDQEGQQYSHKQSSQDAENENEAQKKTIQAIEVGNNRDQTEGANKYCQDYLNQDNKYGDQNPLKLQDKEIIFSSDQDVASIGNLELSRLLEPEHLSFKPSTPTQKMIAENANSSRTVSPLQNAQQEQYCRVVISPVYTGSSCDLLSVELDESPNIELDLQILPQQGAQQQSNLIESEQYNNPEKYAEQLSNCSWAQKEIEDLEKQELHTSQTLQSITDIRSQSLYMTISAQSTSREASTSKRRERGNGIFGNCFSCSSLDTIP